MLPMCECCQCANVANCQLELDLGLGNGNIGYWQHLIKWLAGQRSEDLGLRIILSLLSSVLRPQPSQPDFQPCRTFTPISPFVRFRVRRRPLFVSGGMAKPEGWRRRFHGGRGDLSSVAHSAKEESLKADREIDGANRRKAIRHAAGFVVARSADSTATFRFKGRRPI